MVSFRIFPKIIFFVVDAKKTRGLWGQGDSASKPTEAQEDYAKLVRCCEMSTYRKAYFKLCRNHPENECIGFKIDGEETKCHRIHTEHKYKGVCVPRRKECRSSKDCPKIGNKGDNRGILSARCLDAFRKDTCKYAKILAIRQN